jgi:MFS family permease
VAEKHGRRTVLTLSLFGSAVTVLLFGTCTSLRQAITVRLLQGIFAGAVGVARGCVASVTDVTNEGRAYAIMGYSISYYLLFEFADCSLMIAFAGDLEVWRVPLLEDHVRHVWWLVMIAPA